jgi:hypothetical protein
MSIPIPFSVFQERNPKISKAQFRQHAATWLPQGSLFHVCIFALTRTAGAILFLPSAVRD